jgi:glycosyltransferase involved in cell wall biosynthesis
MRIGIHHEPSSPQVGGGEVVSAILARMMRGRHTVHLLHHRPWMTPDRWAGFATVDLDGVDFRYVPPTGRACWDGAGPPRWAPLAGSRLRRWLGWTAELSAPYDLFVSVCHHAPFCDARVGVLYTLFPWSDRPRLPGGGLRGVLRRGLHEWRWRRRMGSYAEYWAISRFSADWAKARWGVECEVVPPPALNDARPAEKENLIAVVGRFHPSKQQDQVIRAFRRVADRLPGWELICLGGLADDAEGRDYFRRLQEAAAGAPVRLVPNASRGLLQEVLGRAKLFCHAMGAGNDEQRTPEWSEHFGLSTVEAMAACCVPVVVGRGGQPEIVRHGQDGLLWQGWDELGDLLVGLAADDALRRRLAESAVVRAREFGRDRFEAAVRARLARFLVG